MQNSVYEVVKLITSRLHYYTESSCGTRLQYIYSSLWEKQIVSFVCFIMKNIDVISARSRFHVNLMCCITLGSALSACCLLISIAAHSCPRPAVTFLKFLYVFMLFLQPRKFYWWFLGTNTFLVKKTLREDST